MHLGALRQDESFQLTCWAPVEGRAWRQRRSGSWSLASKTGGKSVGLVGWVAKWATIHRWQLITIGSSLIGITGKRAHQSLEGTMSPVKSQQLIWVSMYCNSCVWSFMYPSQPAFDRRILEHLTPSMSFWVWELSSQRAADPLACAPNHDEKQDWQCAKSSGIRVHLKMI